MNTIWPANHPAFRYVGRFAHLDQTLPHNPDPVRFAWSASQIQWRFTGQACMAQLETVAHPEGWCNYFEVLLDDRPPTTLKLDPSQTQYILAADLEPGEHTLTLVKRTEAFFPVVTFRRLELDAGAELLPIQDRPPYTLEFIGDSITCGYGNEATSGEEPFRDATENAYQSWAAIAARELNADVITICHSGFGLLQNYDRTTRPTMFHLYDRTLLADPTPWHFPDPSPDAVIINLGTNDFAHRPPDQAAFVSAYIALIRKVRSHYPQTQIVSVLGPILGDDWPTNPKTHQPFPTLSLTRDSLQQLQAQLAAAEEAGIAILELTPQAPERGYGADFHPSLAQQQLNGQELADFLRPLLPEKNLSNS
ncbi:MAG: SGNH/GDSL hydrolase family protein [Cyanobacteria bacterium P01_G01_bin.54]